MASDSRIVHPFSMQALAGLCEDDPELRRTIEPLVRTLVEIGNPAVRARGDKLLDRLERPAG